jgi:LysM repeat protein/uncharacterized protein YkwD
MPSMHKNIFWALPAFNRRAHGASSHRRSGCSATQAQRAATLDVRVPRGARQPPFIRMFSMVLFLLVLSWLPSGVVLAAPLAEGNPPTASQVIEVVNALRVENGLYPLSVHSALMQEAQAEADGIANGMPGHWRPSGLTLGQWLISLGYPLAGDLSQDGYRSENWIAARSVEEAIKVWRGDGAHLNTMLSPDRSDIGVGIAASGDQVYIVLTTALQTGSGQMQSGAYLMLTQAASLSGGAAGDALVSQYIKPVVLSTARPNGDVFHKVQYGQSLWSVAIAYFTTIDQIRAWNNLGGDTTIYEGQYLLVQRSATQPPPATPTPLASSTLTPSTATVQPPTPSPTPTALSPTMSAGGDAQPQSLSIGFRIGIILIVVAVGGLIGVILLPRAN